MKQSLFLVLTIPLIFISCQAPGGDPIVDPGPVTVEEDSHLGTWETACEIENQGTPASSADDVKFKHRMVISDGFVDLKVTVYPYASNCEAISAYGEFSYKLQYARTADNYTTTLKEYFYKPTSSSYAAFLSTNNPALELPFCGVPWVVNVSQSLLGKDCLIGGQMLKRDLDAPGSYTAVKKDNVISANIDGENLNYNLVP
jgi:hypothetical protein